MLHVKLHKYHHYRNTKNKQADVCIPLRKYGFKVTSLSANNNSELHCHTRMALMNITYTFCEKWNC